MLSKQELERLSSVELAVLCSKLAENSKLYTKQDAIKGRELKYEWASLQTPPEISFQDEQVKKAALAAWRTRAIEFLAGVA